METVEQVNNMIVVRGPLRLRRLRTQSLRLDPDARRAYPDFDALQRRSVEDCAMRRDTVYGFEYRDHFVSPKEFARRLDLASSTVYASKERLSDYEGAKVLDGDKMNVGWALPFMRYKEELMNEAHRLFYDLADRGMKPADMARGVFERCGGSLASWNVFFSHDLFFIPVRRSLQPPGRRLQEFVKWAKEQVEPC